MKMWKCIIALLLATITGMALASAAYASDGKQFAIEVGSFNVGGKDELTWDTADYGTVTSPQKEQLGTRPSLAARYMIGESGGVRFGMGVRTGSTEYSAAMGAQATADMQTASNAANTAQATLDGLDENNPADAAAIAAAQSDLDAANAKMSNIDSQHKSSIDRTGLSVTAMKEVKLDNGNIFGFGGEVFKASEGDAVPAMRVTYGGSQGNADWNVVGYAGDSWAGAGLEIQF